MLRYRLICQTAISLGVAVAGVSGTSVQAATQTQAEDGGAPARAKNEPSQELEAVVVTARRRDELLQSVPVAETVLTGEALVQRGITTVQDLAQAVPSLSVAASQGMRSSPTYAIRGERNLNPKLSLDPSIMLYFADVALARPYGTNSAFYDISSVEVLRGPQGTLFGRNATGGAVLIHPKAPTDDFEGLAEIEYGNYDHFVATAALNLPISDKLSVRVAGRVAKRDGWALNIYNNKRLDDVDNQSWRVSVKFDPNERLSNLFVYDGYHQDNAGSITVPTAVRPNFANTTRFWNAWLAQQQPLGFYTVNMALDPYERLSVNGISNVTTLTLGSVTIKNIAGMRRTVNKSLQSSDGGPGPAQVIIGQDQDVHQYSDELQILGKAFDGSLDWIVGGYLFRESGKDFAPSLGQALLGAPDQAIGGYARAESQAVFAQGTFRPKSVPDLSLTAGARVTWDQRFSILQSYAVSGACRVVNERNVPISPCEFPEKRSYTQPTFTLAVDYKVLPGTLVYATTRTGYRSGGIKVSTVRTDLAPFKPEKVFDVEFGLKSDWELGGMPVRTNLAVYQNWLTDVQRTVFITSLSSAATTTNVGKAEVKGFELEATVIPLEGLRLSGSLSVNDMKYTTPFVTTNGDHTNDPFPLSPKTQYSLGASYRHPLAGDVGELGLDLNYSHQSAITFNEEASPIGHWPGQGILNGSVSLDNIRGSSASVKAWARNLLNKKVIVGGNDQYYSRGYFSVTPGEPRMYGVTLSLDF